MQITCSGKEWCAPLHPITKLTEHIHTHRQTLHLIHDLTLFFPGKKTLGTSAHSDLILSFHFHKIEMEHQFGSNEASKGFAQGSGMHVHHPTSINCQAAGVIQNLTDYGRRPETRCWGPAMSCAIVKSSWGDLASKANGIPACSLPLCCFTGSKYACRKKWGEGMWILFGRETKQQTKGAEADSL